jgi:hypothetical protein
MRKLETDEVKFARARAIGCYLPDHYPPHPVVLVRLAAIADDALRDLLKMSWRVTALKARGRPVGKVERARGRREPGVRAPRR